MSVANWVSLALVLGGLYYGVRIYGLWILETTVSLYLETFNSGVSSQGKPISGPKWEFPNGTVIERFLNGRVNSEKWRQYGPVYRIWSGPHPEIVITTPEDLKYFAADSSNHGKPPNSNMGWFLGELLGQCMGLLGGQDWTRVRRIFNPPFTHTAAVNQIEVIENAARRYVEELPLTTGNSQTTSTEKTGRSFTIPVVKTFTKFPYFLTAQSIYGPMTEKEEQMLWTVTESRLSLNPYMFGGGPYRFERGAKGFDSAAVQKLREYNREWHDFNAGMMKVRRARGERTAIVSYWEEYENGNLTLEELLHTLDELLMVNLDVFTHVITWFITLVADHEEIKRELRDEVMASKDNLLGYLAQTDTHLHRCFYESMRIRPFTIFTIGECAPTVKNFNGILVKPNTQVLVDVLGLNIRNPFWGANSEAFNPSRFKAIKQSDLRYNLHVFGFGSRKCMGQYLAGHIAKALVVHLFHQYEVLVSDGRDGANYDTDKSSWTPKADASLQLTRRDVLESI
ncbi:Cytochrome P450 [Penicillium camemberti]|uniref:Cytochrome P450 n=1 Tax=Penicillium camemberti (strain FM 013) TaxID=1429867 RepID=A0A0G4NTI3_PENC3|nr:Cytochrome P450 [Penicillium camemberti]